VTADTVRDWKREKAAKGKQGSSPKAADAKVSGGAAPVPNSTGSTSPGQPRATRGRPRKIIDSSPELSPKLVRPKVPVPLPVSLSNLQVDPEAEAEPEIVESQSQAEDHTAQGAGSPLFEPLTEPVVEPSEPPSSYFTGAYQKFSSSSQHQPQSSGDGIFTESQGTALVQSVPVNLEGGSRVIPDSQTLIEITSSAPPAIESSKSEQRSASQPVETLLEPPAAASTRVVTQEPPTTQLGHSSRSGAVLSTTLGASTGPKIPEAVPASHSQSQLDARQRTPQSSQEHGKYTYSPEHTQDPSTPFQTQLPAAYRSDDPSPPVHHSIPVHSIESRLPAATKSSPIRLSSPIPSIPPYSIGTIGESAPPRPTTQSSPVNNSSGASTHTMQTPHATPDSKATLAAKLKSLREQHRLARTTSLPRSDLAKGEASNNAGQASGSSVPAALTPKLVSSLLVEAQSRRSPSAVPAVQPEPVVSQQEMNTSERYETLLPQARENGLHRTGSTSGAMLSRQASKANASNASRSHMVPIALIGHQRDQYPSTVHQNAGLVKMFLATPIPDAHLIREAADFVQRMRNVLLHPDLVNAETMTPYHVQPKQQAQWDIDCSAKCRFLKHLFDGLRDQTLNISLVTPPGRIFTIMATFLTGISVPHRSLQDLEQSSTDSEGQGLMVTLLSADDQFPGTPSSTDLVIALSPAVGEDCPPIKTMVRGDSRPLLLTLVVPYSIEHIDQTLSDVVADNARLRLLISGIHQYRDNAGSLEPEQISLVDGATRIVEYLAADDDHSDWPLPELGPVDNLDSQTESEMEAPAVSDEQDTNGVAGPKRHLEHEPQHSEEGKRTRMAWNADQAPQAQLPATVAPQDVEFSRVSDSLQGLTQIDATSAENLSLLSEAEQRLRQMLENAQNRLEEHVRALSSLQYRYEEQRQQLVAVTSNRDDLVKTAQTAIERMNITETRSSSLKVENTALKTQLETANARLLDHSVPERAELERLRLDAARARQEMEAAKSRLDRATTDHEYVREMYQSSSQSAQGLASQVTDLENALAVAQNRATGEQAKLRSMGYDAATEKLRAENAKLKAILKEREAGMKFRDEEIARLKEASRGRMGTRGTSVPRSPRLGSPMKMGSRQASPAAGDLRGKLHPLRHG
jgi:hypothetical protein